MHAVRALLAACLLAASAGAARAQVGTVRGRVLAAADHASVAYALVRLVPVAAQAPVRTALSDADGAFAFAAVNPGSYRLRLERIGYRAEQTDTFTVAASATVERDVVSAARAVALPALAATLACRTAADFERDTALALLWNEAAKGMETRIAFDDAYHYEFDVHQTFTGSRHPGQVQRLDKHLVRDPRAPVDPSRPGWGSSTHTQFSLKVPDGREIVDARFVATHCLDGGVDEASGEYTLGFHPQTARRGRVDIRGEVRLDRATLQVNTIEVEWMDADRVLLRATVEFRDAYVPGGVVRLPVGALFSGTAPPAMGLGNVRGEVRYENFGHLMKVEG